MPLRTSVSISNRMRLRLALLPHHASNFATESPGPELRIARSHLERRSKRSSYLDLPPSRFLAGFRVRRPELAITGEEDNQS